MVMDIVRKTFTEDARFGQPTLAPKVIGEHWVTAWQIPKTSYGDGDTPAGTLISMWLMIHWGRASKCIEAFLGRPQRNAEIMAREGIAFTEARTALCSLARRHHNKVLWELPMVSFRVPFSRTAARLREVEDYLWLWLAHHNQSGMGLPRMRDFL